MAEYNGIQRSQVSAAIDTTPRIYPPVSLATLPSEILAAIIALLPPEGVHPAIFKESYPCSWTPEFSVQNDSPKLGTAATRNDNKWSFLYVNQRFHTEGVRYLHGQRYVIDITEWSIYRTKEDAMEAAFLEENRGVLSLPDLALKYRISFTDSLFPGLMLSQVKELTVHIHPTDLATFWHRVNNAVESLCNEQLLRRGPIKRFIIKLRDMSYGETWRNLAVGTSDSFMLDRTGEVAFEDYEDALRRFKQVIAQSGQCEIHLPYWMERCEQKDRLLQMCTGELGARVLFSPAPQKTPTEEAKDRDGRRLVALPTAYMSSMGS